MAAMSEGPLPEARGLVIKPVCDFADSKKGDDLQAYAYTSASVLKRLVEEDIDFDPETISLVQPSLDIRDFNASHLIDF